MDFAWLFVHVCNFVALAVAEAKNNGARANHDSRDERHTTPLIHEHPSGRDLYSLAGPALLVSYHHVRP